MDEIRKDLEAIDQAGLTSIAMWQPKDLSRERRRVERRVLEFGREPSPAQRMSDADFRAWMLAEAERIEKGGVLEDGTCQ